MMRIIIFALCVFYFGMMAAQEKTLFQENFERVEVAPSFKAHSTAGVLTLENMGKDSAKSLKITKSDSCGFLTSEFKFSVPKESRGHFIKITADIRTEELGIGSDYYLMVSQLENNKSNGKNLFLPYDDGIARQSKFGGLNKTPQTSGLWKQTYHQLRLRPGTDQVKLSIVVSGGEQVIYFDNLMVVEVGTEPLPARRPVVYSEVMNWPYGFVNLDDVIPGATYQVEVEISRPVGKATVDNLSPNAKLSAKRAPKGLSGMGVAMIPYGLDSKAMPTVQLFPLKIDDDRAVYRMTIPEMAVRVELNFHNDDLIRFDHNQIAAQARRYQLVRVALDNYGEVVADNAFHQYVYRGKPEKLKVPQIITSEPFALDVLKNSLQKRPEASLEVVMDKGAMAFKLNEKIIPPMAVSYNGSQEQYRWCDLSTSSGINIIFARTPYGGVSMNGSWLEEDRYDFSGIDRNVYNILKQNPDAVIILSVDSMYPPQWWAEKNRDELLRDQDGNFVWSSGGTLKRRFYGTFEALKARADSMKNNPKGMYIMRGAKESGFFVPSLSSEKYRRDVNVYLKALRLHIESQPYGKAVAGYRFISGHDGQWGLPYEDYGYDKNGIHVFDFSGPSQDRFRAYLLQKYKTEAKLKTAWNNPSVKLSDALIPLADQRDFDQMKDGNSYILDPSKQRQLIDYREFLAESLASLLISYGKTIKDIEGKPVITLAYYPDIVETASGGGGTSRGNELVYRSPYIDVVGGPSYDGRELGQPGRTNVLLSSTVVNGKIHMNEIDHRLYTTVKRNYSGNMVFDSPRKTISVLRREYMRQMCSGNGSWLYDMGYGWHNEPLMAAILGQCYDVFAKTLELDRSSNAQMAVYLSRYPKLVQADARRGAIPLRLGSGAILKIAQAGFPIDQYQMADLQQTADRYKIFYFPLAYGLTPQEIAEINRLKKNKNILIFGYAAGYAADNIGLENVEQLTGFKLGMKKNLDLTVCFQGKHSLIKGMEGQFFGSGGKNTYNKGVPGIYVDDVDAEVLAIFAKTKFAGVAVKKHEDWTGIYLGTMESASPRFLRNVAEFAGLHVYNQDEDVMYFNNSLIGIHAASEGVKTIKLPVESKVFSLWDNHNAGNLKSISRYMKVGENALYKIEK